MTADGKAASVHDRLLAKARASGSDFNLLLTRYSLERFLYRVSASHYQTSFLLKGPSSSASGTIRREDPHGTPTCLAFNRWSARKWP